MNKMHSVSTLIIGWILDLKKDSFRLKDDDEKILGAEVSYLIAIDSLLYLAQYTTPYVSFYVNLLDRFSSAPTQSHWSGIKTTFRYLKGTIDFGLFHPYKETRVEKASSNLKGFAAIRAAAAGQGIANNPTPYAEIPCDVLVGFADVGYLFNPHKDRFQTGYVFTMRNTTISWRF